MTYVCPERDIVCGERTENWCGRCPLRRDAQQPVQMPDPATGGKTMIWVIPRDYQQAADAIKKAMEKP